MFLITATILVILLLLIDLSLTTIFYCHGAAFSDTFSHLFVDYNFSTSVLELWLLCLVRNAVICGFVIGLCYGQHSSIGTIKSWKIFVQVVSGLQGMFTLIKLLSVSEHKPFMGDNWFWLLFSWTLVSSVVLYGQWKILANVRRYPATFVVNDCEVNGRERESLLGNGHVSSAANATTTTDTDTGTRPVNRGNILRLIKLSKDDWPIVVTGFFFLTVSATGEIFIPFYTGKVVDGIVIDRSEEEFTRAIIIMALISVVSAFAAGVRGGCFTLSCERLNMRIRNTLFSSIMNQDVEFFDNTQTGDITSRLTSDTSTMSDAMGLNVNIFLRSFIKAAGVIFFMLKLSWRLTIITFIGLPCIIVVSKVYGKYYKQLSEDVQDSLADANNVAEEACSSIRTVRSFANETQEIGRYASKLSVTYRLNKKQAVMYSGFVWCTMLFQLALTVSVLYYGGHLVITGTISGGTLISFILYQIQLGDCVNNMGNVYTGMMQAVGASAKVFEYIDRKPALNKHGNLAPQVVEGHIEFKDVCFSYPTRPNIPVLKNINIKVKPGEVIALVGPSGGGKSSCVNLLEYFYKPNTGSVLLDNQPIHSYDHHFLHKQISLVGQEPVLYARSIEENISYGLNDDEFTAESIRKAAEMANAHKFITELKDGYQTQAGEKGIQMSGGQKQRIAIARALLRQPSVLLLDEATSALDSESEYLVQQALYKNLIGRTVLIIAHRLSTVERADRIIVIDKGQVIEEGSHKDLVNAKGVYSKLVKRQLLLSDNYETGGAGSGSGGNPNNGGTPCGANTNNSFNTGNSAFNHTCDCHKRSTTSATKRFMPRRIVPRTFMFRDNVLVRDDMGFMVGSV